MDTHSQADTFHMTTHFPLNNNPDHMEPLAFYLYMDNSWKIIIIYYLRYFSVYVCLSKACTIYLHHLSWKCLQVDKTEYLTLSTYNPALQAVHTVFFLVE